MLSSKIPDTSLRPLVPPSMRSNPPGRQDTSPLPRAANSDALSPLQLLIVDDEAESRNRCAEIGRQMGYEAHLTDSLTAARAFLQLHAIDLLLLDVKLPGGAGMVLLEEVRALYPDTTVVAMAAFATVDSAVQAMKTGANDYLKKPFSVEELTGVLERSSKRRRFDTESRQLRERLRTQKGKGDLIGRTQEMEKLYRILSKVAFTTHPVLILGESGTGKEVVARTIHFNGPNADKPFIPVDCGSLVPTLIESELFGYVKGAFTGANKSKDGLLAAADGGTVFLDEIGELPLDLQAKLLRALQEKEVRPVGATHAVGISARILAATNRDLAQMVEQGRFRKDLFFRLNVVNLRIPPLRDRKPDIPLLAMNVVERMRRDTGTNYMLADDALRLMMDYDWPGNVRELEHAIERACALSSGPVLHMGDFPTQLQNFHFQHEHDGISPYAVDTSAPQVISIAEMEKQAILGAIKQLNGDKLMAARLLGIGKTTLYRKLKEYGIESEPEEDA